MSKIEELKAAYAAASDGTTQLVTWPDYNEDGNTGEVCIGDRTGMPIACTCETGTEATAEFFALVHNMMPALLETADAMLESLSAWQDEEPSVQEEHADLIARLEEIANKLQED